MAGAGYAAAAGAGAGAIGGMLGARSTNKNIGAARNYINQYSDKALGEYSTAGELVNATLNPYVMLGGRTIPDIEKSARNYIAPTMTGFNMQDYFNDPGYQFELNQGRQAIDQGAAARGNYFSPATTQALGDYQQGLASTHFNEAFNRYLQQTQGLYGQQMGSQQQYYNQLAQLLGYGAGASGQLATSQFNTGAGRAGIEQQRGSDLANLALGKQNPWASAFQGAVSGAGAGMGAYNMFSSDKG